MKMFDLLVIVFGKAISFISRLMNLGAGATWPGEIALRLNPHILSQITGNLKKGVIIVAGTNGKTTTALMIKQILEDNGESVVHNASGANLENGIVSALIQKSDADWGVFEVDENSMPLVLQQISHSREPALPAGGRGNPEYDKTGSPIRSGMTKRVIIVLLNLFRDQLDRYGEVDVIAEKWQKALESLRQSSVQALEAQDRKTRNTNNVKIIANADDPLIAHLGITGKLSVTYFGINDKTKYLSKMEHATDSIFCLDCGGRLSYEGIYYSHIGIWYCTKCKEKRPTTDTSDWKSPLPGLYNQYNTLAAVSAAKTLLIKDKNIETSLASFQPAFGRQEVFVINGKRIKIFLSKNPVGFNQSIKTALELGATQLLFVLNDRIPDGRDVSWIWDVDFEIITEPRGSELNRGTTRITVSGDRAYDMSLRMKYDGLNCEMYKNLAEALKQSIENVKSDETLYILPTYSAMLEVRKLLSGRKIL